MLTDTRRPTAATRFGLQAVAGSLAIFSLLRLSWTEAHVVLPATRLQGGLAVDLFGTAALPVEATLACSGADALALCLGAVLAYPVPWRRRFAGAVGGAALILGLNTLRIGTLGLVVTSPAWFNALHVFVWPAVLTLAIAGYVFTWMRVADLTPRVPVLDGRPPAALAAAERAPQPSRRFIVLTIAFLVLFSAASPLYLESPSVLALAGFIARAAAALLGVISISAHAAGNVLLTPRGGFLVTQECISTPLIPVYLAAICTYAKPGRWLILGVLATVPLFAALGIVRLLVVALPDAVMASPMFLVHAFYQLLLGAVVVFIAALWRRDRSVAAGYALAGITAGFLFVYLLGPAYTQMAASLSSPLDDPQGAIGFLPVFQAGLYVALSVAALLIVDWKAAIAGFAVLGLTQAVLLLALQAIAQAGAAAHVRDIRGWAIAGPVLIVGVVAHASRTRH